MVPWHQNGYLILLASALLPPFGLALAWFRSGWGIIRKLLVSLLVCAFALGHLFLFFGLRVQFYGDAMRPHPYFPAGERHYAEIDKLSAPAPAATPAATPAAQAVPARPVTTPWPSFYGALRNGTYLEPILAAWPAKGLPQLWRRPVGGGYASVVVAENKIFTLEQRRGDEVLAAYDFDSGRELWKAAWKGEFKETMGGDGPRSTPTYDAGRVYVLGAEGEFRAVEAATGKVVWSKNILADNGATNVTWGMAASPLAYGDKVVVMPGGAAGRCVVAYNKLTGERAWSALDDKASYTSPMLVTLDGVEQVLVVTGSHAAGLDSTTGAVLWTLPWTSEYDTSSTQPVLTTPNRFIVTSGYGGGSALIEVKRDGGKWEAKRLWLSNMMKSRFNGLVLRDGVVYGIDEGILAAMDAATGQRKWKGGRYGFGQLLLAGAHLIVLTETGEVVLVKAVPERHEEVARFEALQGKTWNVPALAEGRLLVRNTTEMVCYRIAP